MPIKKYLKQLNEQEDIKSTKIKIMDFFKNNPKPTDKEVHSFAKSMRIDEHKFEEIIYDIMGTFFGAGRAKDFTGDYDLEQLKMGVQIEKEHTTCALIAERISKDHLAECNSYYTRLKKMESECEDETENNKEVK